MQPGLPQRESVKNGNVQNQRPFFFFATENMCCGFFSFPVFNQKESTVMLQENSHFKSRGRKGAVLLEKGLHCQTTVHLFQLKDCNQYLGLGVFSAPHLDSLSNPSQWELLVLWLKLSHCITAHCASFCPRRREQSESVGKNILNGPRKPVCSSCYPLKPQTMGTGADKRRACLGGSGLLFVSIKFYPVHFSSKGHFNSEEREKLLEQSLRRLLKL